MRTHGPFGLAAKQALTRWATQKILLAADKLTRAPKREGMMLTCQPKFIGHDLLVRHAG